MAKVEHVVVDSGGFIRNAPLRVRFIIVFTNYFYRGVLYNLAVFVSSIMDIYYIPAKSLNIL